MPSSSRRAAASRGPGAAARHVGRAALDQLGDHAADAAAIGLLAVAVLLALGLYGDAAGPVGDGLGSAATVAVGRAAYALPPLLVAGAALALWRPSHQAPLRVALGAGLVVVSGVGLLHLATGAPTLRDGIDPLRESGGVLGAITARPLQDVAQTAGAGVVLAAGAILGLLLVSGMPLRRLVAAIGRSTAAAVRAATRVFRIGAEPAGDSTTDDADLWTLDDVEPATAPELDVAVPVAVVDDASLPTDEVDEAEPDDLAAATIDDVAETSDGASEVSADIPAPTIASSDWELPPLSLLDAGRARLIDRRLAEDAGRVLEQTLADFGVDARLVGMTIGPTVTRYELELASGVKVNKVRSLTHDIAYAMASPDVRILAPIPGRSAVGVEVPNRQRQIVTLGEILSSTEATRATHPLQVGLGRDIAGRPIMCNLAEMPHLLIAGATGAGKSSCINSIVTSVLMRSTPEEVRLILVDPKRVELGGYNDLPHLLTAVVTDPKKAANALDWAVREMDLRYERLARAGVRDINGYNAAVDAGELTVDDATGDEFERLPFVLVVVDELNDLMMVAARDVEASICRIAQMARAVGIHLVIATQRPSVDVITGVIKANIPSRLAFSVTSAADSRVILDQQGAEKLVGQGDMLVMTASESRTQRVQGSWVTEGEVRRVAAHWKRQARGPHYVEGIADEETGSGTAALVEDDGDELLDEALDLVVRSQLGSTSMLQRKLRVGFARAGRLMDLLERRGVVGPSEGSKARSVLMTVEELEEMRERVDA